MSRHCMLLAEKNKASRNDATYASGNPSDVSSGSAISISDMVDFVKDYFSDVLSDDAVNVLDIVRMDSEFTPNLKYSLNTQRDEECSAAVQQGDMETARRMVDEIANNGWKEKASENSMFSGALRGAGGRT